MRSFALPFAAARLSATIAMLSEELTRDVDEIAQLKEELSRLESRCAALEAYHIDYTGLLALVRRLPSEILLDIFALCWPGDLRLSSGATLKPVRGWLILHRNRSCGSLSLELDALSAQPEHIDFSEFVPNLKRLVAQLQPHAIAQAVSSLARLSNACAVRLEVFLDDWDQSHSAGLHIPQTSSNIASLLLEVTWDFDSHHCVQTFTEMLDGFTLPSLHDLSFKSSESDRDLLWSHLPFLSLAARSSFHTHLHSLQLASVCITEVRLVECLSAVPTLQQLAIADRSGQLLMTNAFLSALTRPQDDSRFFAPCTPPADPRLQVIPRIQRYYLFGLPRLTLGAKRIESNTFRKSHVLSKFS
ncbi:F-box domain-containing protein [Mycena venus]|uniref:F-box domain-containing protein n=1 Tax=Mycena venus TaxID=2733690 RepID=A0A8H6Y514_9AGAR|nr:F-box domain-containing protein [Mycena venus]